MATSDPKLNEITTASQKLAAQQSHKTLDFEMEDSDQDSSSEISTTEDSSVYSPIAKAYCTRTQFRISGKAKKSVVRKRLQRN